MSHTTTRKPLAKMLSWLNSDSIKGEDEAAPSKASLDKESKLSHYLPFAFLHAGCLLVFLSGWSPVAVLTAIALYWIRIFAITAFYHRYFSHRTYSTNRFFQCVFAIIGMTAVQRGPLWWAAHHRNHHNYSDTEKDFHSPIRRGFWFSHIGWMTCPDNLVTDYSRIPDLVKFPELVFLNRYDWAIPVLFSAVLYGFGGGLKYFAPELGTDGFQMIAWGFFVSTVVVFHATCTINSLSHIYGSQRFNSGDTSRNNFILAMITMGEGWHNNHHRYPGSVRQGFFWWEIDVTYYVLKFFSFFGIVRNLHRVPESIYVEARATKGQAIPMMPPPQPVASSLAVDNRSVEWSQ